MTSGPTPPPFSPLTDAADRAEFDEPHDGTVIRARPPPPVLPLTDFELEVRTRLAGIDAHIARTDGVVLDLQRDFRDQLRGLEARLTAQLELVIGLASRMAADVAKLVKLGANGDAHG